MILPVVTITTMETTEDDWDSIMAVHLKGHFSCAKAAIAEMIKQKSGRIINISSRAATFGAASPAYNTAKAGILGFTRALAHEQGYVETLFGRRLYLPEINARNGFVSPAIVFLRIARKEASIDLMNLPVAAPEAQ